MRYGAQPGVDTGWCRHNMPTVEDQVFTDPYVVAGVRNGLCARLRALGRRAVDRAVAWRLAQVVPTSAPVPVPVPPAPVPVSLPVELELDFVENLDKLRATPTATLTRWGFSEGWEVPITARVFPTGVFDGLNSPNLLCLGAELAATSSSGLRWTCPSGRTAREQARTLSTVSGLGKLVVHAYVEDLAHNRREVASGPIGSSDFWIALRQLDGA